MTPIRTGLSGAERARVLAAGYYVPLGADGSVLVLDLDGVPVLPAFATEPDLPERPLPGSVGWAPVTGHDLISALPPGAFLYVEPSGEALSTDELRAPTVELLRRARTEQPDLHEPFTDAVLYCRAAEPAGFLADDDGMIEVFSSLPALRHVHGQTAWFAATGTDLLDLLPAGYRFILDRASPHEALI